ncbi:glycoside hydrolase N-terminal domain-containing protein [Arachidicoccus ginsenosidivorans]|uniref:glycoside hydrolase N-terminal domain-containing protein n=1 Tax=Arachidicoccus ginsenosidivorans TaxID=496057 RepID=UPI002938EFE5|nr:glycoside hydrolase N-terminal domain-containing protein [Arachidicoccus ginsenosidivorans]
MKQLLLSTLMLIFSIPMLYSGYSGNTGNKGNSNNKNQDGTHQLWYSHPAIKWDQNGLPIGNGRMGAMMMGGLKMIIFNLMNKVYGAGIIIGMEIIRPETMVLGLIAILGN